MDEYPGAVFVIAGEGYLKLQLESKARDLGVKHAVHFLGRRLDVPKLLKAADIFAMPSLWEGMPIALLEAMVSARPVVATKVEGVEEIIKSTNNGLLVPPADPQALSGAIKLLLSDSILRKNLASAARRTVEKFYTSDRMCEAYNRLFNQLMGEV